MRDNFVSCNQEFHQYQNPVKSFCFSKGVESCVANGMALLQIIGDCTLVFSLELAISLVFSLELATLSPHEHL